MLHQRKPADKKIVVDSTKITIFHQGLQGLVKIWNEERGSPKTGTLGANLERTHYKSSDELHIVFGARFPQNFFMTLLVVSYDATKDVFPAKNHALPVPLNDEVTLTELAHILAEFNPQAIS